MKVFAQIKKVDEAKRLVFGRAAQEVVDKSDEVMDYASSKPHFAKWSEEVSKDTDGKSLGNLRAMHGKVAAGKLVGIEFNDTEKAVDVVAKVVDDAEWKKVLEGVYTGFSIGGSYVGAPTVEKVDGRDVKRYTAKPNELSLVDRPCIPSAKFFEIQKADGTAAKVDFKEAAPEPVEVRGTDAEVLAFGKMLNDAGLGMADALEMVSKGMPAFLKDKEKAKEGAEGAKAEGAAAEGANTEGAAAGKEATEEEKKVAEEKAAAAKKEAEKADPALLRKGVYDTHHFATALQALVCLKKNTAYEAMQEGDKSPLPGKLDACVAMVGEVFKAFIDEVVKESKAGTEATTAMIALAEQAAGLFKDFSGDPALVLAKEDTLAKIHAAKPEHVITDSDQLQKMVQEAMAPLSKQLGEAQAMIKKLEAMPAAPRVSLMAVSKAQDLGDGAEPLTKEEPVRTTAGKEDETASLIKSLHRKGGAPLLQSSPLRK